MKKSLSLMAGGLLLAAAAFAAPPLAYPGADVSPLSVNTTLTNEELDAVLGVPAPVDDSTSITWVGGTCTAWLFCTGEPYWKCQSTTGNCHVTNCSMTCNGNTRSCPPRSNCRELPPV